MNIKLIYIISLISLFSFLSIYIFIAKKFRIIDKPNERSSHTYDTVRGGGTVFVFGIIMSYIFDSSTGVCFVSGLLLLSAVSFLDDLIKLNAITRFFFQVLGVAVLFLHFKNAIDPEPWFIILGLITGVGILNSFNFMDGINGITGLYSLSVLLPLQWVNLKIVEFISPITINITIIAIMVFLFFNYRKEALCFAGDVGSIGIGFIILFFLLSLIIKTKNIFWLILLSVYGVDVLLTLIHRIIMKENIFRAHRLHFYQILANRLDIDHRTVSAFYGLTQIVVTITYLVLSKIAGAIYICMAIIALLSILYSIKFLIIRNEGKNINNG